MEIPAGFEPLERLRTSPFLERIGPLYFKREGKNLVLGLRVDQTHANAYLTVGDKRIARVSAVFARGDSPLPKRGG